jgi:Icc-related predicted phosphoesterase
MELILTSDLHGALPVIPACDLFIIAGDICPIDNHDLDHQANWLHEQFAAWLAEVPARYKVFIAGNHDVVFEQMPELVDLNRIPGIYLQDSGCQIEGVSIWGSPWARELPGWPFTANEDRLARHWAKINRDTEVLVVHGPPYGYGDRVERRPTGNDCVGSRSLLAIIDQLPRLTLVVFGHIHEGTGVYDYNGITFVNASLMNKQYQPVNPLRTLRLRL